ncbi:MAG TPA: glycosyltransferase family 4 protein [Thermoplasmata archaeon]|nr:glycosyltransferase family 4 protein [Thermoplasmata archaeon]
MRATFLLHTDMFRPSPIFRAVKEASALAHLGVLSTAVCWIKGTLDLPPSETIDGVTVKRYVFQPSPQSLFHLVRRYRELRRVTRDLAALVAATHPDVIVAHDLEVLSAGVRAGAGRVPVVYDAHEDWPAMVGETSPIEGVFSSILERRLSRQVAAVVTPSELIAEKFRAWGARAETLHNAPYEAEVEPLPTAADVAQIREGLGVAGAFVLGYVGTLAPKRGLELAVEALAGLPHDVRFVVVGGPATEAERIRGLAQRAGVGDRVSLVGRVPRRDVSRYTAAFDLALVLPPPASRNYLTTLPNKAYDCMAVGVPILASDLPALRRLIVDEARAGIVVAPEVRAVREAIMDLRGNPGLLKELGRNGLRAFRETYAWEKQEPRFLALLRDIGVGPPFHDA